MREGEINLKVLFITNVPFPYTVDYLEELGKYCELVAVFERKSSSERDKSWDFYKFKNCKAIILKGIHFGVVVLPWADRYSPRTFFSSTGG